MGLQEDHRNSPLTLFQFLQTFVHLYDTQSQCPMTDKVVPLIVRKLQSVLQAVGTSGITLLQPSPLLFWNVLCHVFVIHFQALVLRAEWVE